MLLASSWIARQQMADPVETLLLEDRWLMTRFAVPIPSARGEFQKGGRLPVEAW